MKTVFIFNMTVVAALAIGLSADALADGEGPPRTTERLAAIVSYVVADYPGAVRDHAVLAKDEYKEQEGLLAEGAQIADALPGERTSKQHLASAFAEVRHAFSDKADEVVLATAARSVHKILIEEFNLVLAPTGTPSPTRAAQVYAAACARCHGADGHADTEEGKKLEPHPVSFFDAGRMRRISPELAFHALTFGVTGTGMAAFDTLPPADRWSLAFHVVALRHRAADAKRGEVIVARVAGQLPRSASQLAAMTDDEIAAVLPGLSEDDLAAALAYLRTDAPFRMDPRGRFAVARARLTELAAAADDQAKARELAVAAYLEGVEPHEAALKAKDPGLSERLEKAFLELRVDIDKGVRGDALRKEVARTQLVVDSVEERAAGGASVPFAAAFAIALREGFELSLLLAALLAFLRRAGRTAEARYVHLGWVAAVPAGFATWFVIGAALSGTRRELTEGILTLVAAAMLLFVSHFVLGKLESRRWLKFLEQRTMDAGGKDSGKVGLALFSVAFVAAYREAIEIVLFFKALLLDSTSGPLPVIAGAAAGIFVLSLVVFALGRLGRRLNPRPLMMVSSVVLTVLAISLVGQGVRALQEAGAVGLSSLSLPSLPTLGVYPTLEGLAAQAVVLLLVILPTLLAKQSAKPPTVARTA